MELKRYIKQLSDQIVHVYYSFEEESSYKSNLIAKDFSPGQYHEQIYLEDIEGIKYLYKGACVLKQNKASLCKKDVYKYVIDGEPVIKKKLTANGEVSYIENARQEPERTSYEGQITFQVGKDELLLGLGQYEDGVFDYRNRTEYLYESNMRIAIPFLITTGHYAIFIDSESNMIFNSNNEEVTFTIDTTKELSYYVILGEDTDDILKQFHLLTGKASMMPRWMFGYIQSKERYDNAQELLETAKEFRDRKIPIDCLVQDWYTWEEGLWGEKIFDKKRYPDLPGTVEALHNDHFRFMVSVWPNMSPDGENYAEFAKVGKLLPNSNVYDAFDEEARDLYFRQCQDEILAAGTDAFWCDNAEPFSDADWSGIHKKPESERYQVVVDESKKSMEWERLNSYGLYHAKGMYDNWRKTIKDKRMVNLTRSGYASGQQYGTILWSGDITAKWETMRKQIVEGMKAGLCGVSYWTLDIGGFFVVKDKYENRGCNNTSTEPIWFWDGDYNDGVEDMGYRELYTRWIQFGAFLPIFRSHGTDTPREPWQFGDKGDMFYDVIVKYIRLRYQLMPYIYSLAAKAHSAAYTMMRSLAFDFAEDAEALNVVDEYMFGDAFLVAPVLEPMYYEADSKVLSDVKKVRKVYLPKGTKWYDFWTNQVYEGGQYIEAEADIDKMPIFVKAGSIIPFSADMEYADERNGEVSFIRVYEGADGTFELYNDSGDGYAYEEGEFSLLTIKYFDDKKEILFEKRVENYPMQKTVTIQRIKPDATEEYILSIP